MYRQLMVRPVTAPPAAAAVLLFSKTSAVPPAYAPIDRLAGGALAAALARTEFSASRGSVSVLYPDQSGAAKGFERLFVLGVGDVDKFTLEGVRIAAAKLLRAAWTSKVTSVRLDVAAIAGDADLEAVGRALGDGLAIANFEFDAFKGTAAPGSAGSASSGKKAASPAPLDFTIELDPSQKQLRAGIERSLTLGDSVNLARTLAATPPNVANPQYLAAKARAIAKETGLKCRVIEASEAAKLGMGGLLAVGGAGSAPPVMITLEHKPKGLKNAKAPVMVVGKAVTFDTGGYSIKPADSMDRMKYDKCGGCAVLAIMHAVATLDLPIHVVGVVPSAENMISERAYRPGDIVRFFNGVTSEITNTDAEGRVILADALSWGITTYKPRAVVDMATLTGGVVVALGSACAGAFCPDPDLRSHLFDAADDTGERLWHLPLWDEYRQLIKGTHGDIVNAGTREASPCQGAAFLSYFIEPDGREGIPTLPWAHLDIAGVADVKGDTGLFPKGPTGFGVRLLVRALETWDAKGA
ncbi:MAG: leucyl aminopeptidase [Planctomycetota bacterium]|nr:leucyl aminopeptidase [Planctomycetota bacterium]